MDVSFHPSASGGSTWRPGDFGQENAMRQRLLDSERKRRTPYTMCHSKMMPGVKARQSDLGRVSMLSLPKQKGTKAMQTKTGHPRYLASEPLAPPSCPKSNRLSVKIRDVSASRSVKKAHSNLRRDRIQAAAAAALHDATKRPGTPVTRRRSTVSVFVMTGRAHAYPRFFFFLSLAEIQELQDWLRDAA